MSERKSYTIRVVMESERSRLQQMAYWVASKIREACRNSNHGTIVVAIYDDNDDFVSSTQIGGEEGAAERLLAEEFGIENVPPPRDQGSQAS
jgi:hypothetical protein